MFGAAEGGRVESAARWKRSAWGGWNGASGSAMEGKSGFVASLMPQVGLCSLKCDTWQSLRRRKQKLAVGSTGTGFGNAPRAVMHETLGLQLTSRADEHLLASFKAGSCLRANER